MSLKEYRNEIDRIDGEILRLFQNRMDVAEKIADYKRENGLPVLDAGRERDKLNAIAQAVPEDMRGGMRALYAMVFDQSRARQRERSGGKTELRMQVEKALEDTPKLFPQDAAVACQGVEGAYSQIACGRIFKNPQIMYFNTFESVFSAIESGLCRYGILPIENSSAGSVKKVYDLMQRHDFRIVRSARLKVDHNLLVKPGAKLSDVREVVSHEQALSQCADYLEKLGVKISRCENTAAAARLAAQSERNDIAAIASRRCAALYGLEIADADVQDFGNNYTRFICISKDLEIYPGADRTSVSMILPHEPGSLCKVLMRFFALGINIVKLESRPIPERDFEFNFYFDLDTSVYSDEFGRMLDDLAAVSEEFRYFGSYSEVI